jgi:hypothetical protein
MESSCGCVALAVTVDGWQIRVLLAFPLHVQLCISDLRTDSSDGNSTVRFEVIAVDREKRNKRLGLPRSQASPAGSRHVISCGCRSSAA